MEVLTMLSFMKVPPTTYVFIEAIQSAGGTKHMESRVCLSAFDHANTEVILHAVDQAPWRDEDTVQGFVYERKDSNRLAPSARSLSLRRL